MSKEKQTITESEYRIMTVLWKSEKKLTVAEVVSELSGTSWSASTVSTFLQRLLKKGVVACEKRGKTNLYFPVLTQSEYDLNETENFLTKIYNGSAKNLVAALYESKKLSGSDISELKKMFDLE